MTDIREVIARAICKANGYIPDVVIYRNPKPVFCWQKYTLDATEVLAALDKAGMVVVPKNALEQLETRLSKMMTGKVSYINVCLEDVRAMLAATPTLPILHGNGVEDDTAALQAMVEDKPYVDETK